MTPQFRAPGVVADHVEDIGLKGKSNGELLAAISGTYDILVTGDTNLEHQQNLSRFDIAVVLIHPPLLVIEQIVPLIPAALAAFETAPKHAVTAVGAPKPRRRG